MTAAEAIAMLDRQISEHGQPVTIRRMVANGEPIELPIPAFVRGYKPDELVGGISQGDTMVVVSPTNLVGTPFADAPLRSLDKVVISGRERSMASPDPVSIGDTVVRYNLTVRG